MKRFASAVLMLALRGGAIAAGASSHSTAGDAEQVRQLQGELIDAYIHHDITALDRILADDYTFTNEHGQVETKQQVLSNFKSGGDRTIVSYEVHDPQIRIYGDAAVMLYSYTSREQYRGQDESGSFQITRVFVKMNGSWKIVAGHETRLAKSR
jgi:ketosteroid isomerase-like protein